MSNKYWSKRLEGLYDISREEMERELSKAFNKSADGIIADIAALFEILEEEGDAPLASHMYSNNKYFQLLSKINYELNKLGEKERKIFDNQILKMYEKTSQMVQNEFRFEVSFENMAEKIIDKVWCADGKSYSQRIWGNKKVLQEQLTQGLIDCCERGLSKEKVITEMSKTFNVDRNKTSRLVRTELTYAQNQACLDTFEKAGVERYEYLAEIDERTSEICEEMDGSIFRLDEAVVGENFPPLHANCRCTIVPVMEE